jgi:TonB family protein
LAEELQFVVEDEESRRTGVSTAVVVSAIVHSLLIYFLITHWRTVSEPVRSTQMVHYVELMRANPEFTEAPGARTKTAPLNAPFSDANRRASTPNPNGDKPTLRPGEGGLFTPRTAAGEKEAARQQQQLATAESELSAQPQPQAPSSAPAPAESGGTFQYRPSQASASINWNNAIKEVGKIASLGTGQNGVDLGGQGGDKGFAESGPLSFETQWYDWGEYAQSMVNRIRVNWYANMPQLIQTGLKGVVSIRFTIQRSGAITDITILSSSGVPPYDFAAKKAIELSSPLNPLPADFPNPSERVTCTFFYNQEPPSR